MAPTVEELLSRARAELGRAGALDAAAFAARYPERREELLPLLEVMVRLHEAGQDALAEARTRDFAIALFHRLRPAAEPSVGELFRRQREQAGLSAAEQARRLGLSLDALERLEAEGTPVRAVDNLSLRQLAARLAAPFATLAKEFRRLLSLEHLAGLGAAPVFTRGEEATPAEQQELLAKVRRAARPTAEPPGGGQG